MDPRLDPRLDLAGRTPVPRVAGRGAALAKASPRADASSPPSCRPLYRDYEHICVHCFILLGSPMKSMGSEYSAGAMGPLAGVLREVPWRVHPARCAVLGVTIESELLGDQIAERHPRGALGGGQEARRRARRLWTRAHSHSAAVFAARCPSDRFSKRRRRTASRIALAPARQSASRAASVASSRRRPSITKRSLT